MPRLKNILAVLLCCVVLSFDAGSSYVYAANIVPAYTIGQVAWDIVGWGLISALGIAAGEATGAVDYLTENVWTPLVAHLKEKWGSMCDVFIDKTNNKSYVSKDLMQDALDWGIDNNLWDLSGSPDLNPLPESNQHHFFDNRKFIEYCNGVDFLGNGGLFNSENFLESANEEHFDFSTYNVSIIYGSSYDKVVQFLNFQVPANGYFTLSSPDYDSLSTIKVYDSVGDQINIYYRRAYLNSDSEISQYGSFASTNEWNIRGLTKILSNIGTGESTPAKDYAIDSGLTVPKAGEKIDDWLSAQDKVNGGSVGLLGNDVAIPSDVTGTGAAIDSLPLTIPSFADLVINGQLAIDDILSQGLVKANAGAIADTQAAAGAVAGAEDVAATGENAEANAISVDQAQAALKNLMQQGIDYIAIEIPNNFWNKIPFSIPYDIYLLIHGIFVGSSGGSKKAPRREASSGSNMPVGDPSNVGIEIDIPTVPLKYTEEKSEDTPPNFTFALNIPYTTPTGETANFNKEFTIETAKYNYFAKIIKFSIGLLWLSSVFQWLLAIFSKG